MASVILSMEEWSTIRALVIAIGKEPIGGRGHDEYTAAEAVVAAVLEAKQKAGLC